MQWRFENTLTECVDIIIKGYRKHLKWIFDKFSGKHSGPGTTSKNMELDEFTDFVNLSGMINDCFAAREISLLFNLSMLT